MSVAFPQRVRRRWLGLPGTAFWVAGKVDDDEHRAAVYALIDREFGRIDHFVSNAGVNPGYGPMLDIEPAAMRKIIEINVISALTWSKDAVAAGRHHDKLCESAL